MKSLYFGLLFLLLSMPALAAQTFTVTNSGTANLTIGTSNVTGTNASDFSVSGGTCTNGTVVTSGNTCTSIVTFAPSATGSRNATLNVPSNAATVTSTLTGTGVASGSPTVGLSASTLTYASTSDGTTTAAQSVTVTNSGTTNLIVGTLTLTGTNASDFTKTVDTCSGQTVFPANTCTISATMTPSIVGAETATINIPSNATTATITLNGTGAAAGGTTYLAMNGTSYTTTGAVPVGATADNGNDTAFVGNKVTIGGVNKTVSAIAINIDASVSASNILAGIYTDNAGVPGTLVVGTTITAENVFTGWAVLPVTSTVLTANTTYWVIFTDNAFNLGIASTTTGGTMMWAIDSGFPASTMPTSVPTESGTGTTLYSMYLTLN